MLNNECFSPITMAWASYTRREKLLLPCFVRIKIAHSNVHVSVLCVMLKNKQKNFAIKRPSVIKISDGAEDEERASSEDRVRDS